MSFGRKIKQIRESKGLSQRELGERLGVTQQTIAQYEKINEPPKAGTIKKIADALEVDTSKLLEYKTTVYDGHVFTGNPKETDLFIEVSDFINANDDLSKRKIESKMRLLALYEKAYNTILTEIEELEAESNDLKERIDKLSIELYELKNKKNAT